MIDYSYIVHDDDNVKGFRDKYSYMSNFHACPVYFDGQLYESSEHAYQAAKTLDHATRRTLFTGCTASQAKKNGGIVEIRPDWHQVRVDVMSSVVFDKFYRNRDLRLQLLSTGRKHLEETNHWGDRFWGVCDGKGDNNLGKVLMGVRAYWGSIYPDLLGTPVKKNNPLF